ncbi:AAA family ATPase, partial [Kitasatospora sp. MBT63]|uniref:AAA family ATPase n=1 Tax=Kitasatospora sp. MBT63 TaxID=1444768 RepID=UPI00053A7C5F
MSSSPSPSPRYPTRPLPAGRQTEFGLLRQALDRCVAGTGGVAVLHGSVGSGRSEMLYALADLAAAQGVQVLVGTGSPLEREFPLGLARQVLQSADLDPEEAATAERLLAAGAAESAAAGGFEGGSGQLGQATLEGLFCLVRTLAERAPVLIAVDDRQDADSQSLEFLLYLVRRTRSAPVLTVLSSRETMTPPLPFFEVELARQPHHRHVRLELLSGEQVAQLFRERFGAAAAERWAAEAHALTGGNPLLVHALMDDQERAARAALAGQAAGSGLDVATAVTASASAAAGPGLVAGEGYRRGLMHCLHRIDPLALRCARGVAVLGSAARPELLAELLLLVPDSVTRASYLLHAAGLFVDGGFRHPTAAGDLLAALRPGELARLHRRAAELLGREGAPAEQVAEQLRAAEGQLRSPWAVTAAGES